VTIPQWVDDLHQYQRWFERTIECSGGIPDPHYLIAEQWGVSEVLGIRYEHGFTIERQELIFPGMGVLTVRLVVAEHLDYEYQHIDFEHVWYGYTFRSESQRLIWRYDKHDDHHGVGECHVHLPRGVRGEIVRPAPEVDLQDVIEMILSLHPGTPT
jgi:hypothetical protein